ncbi:MAG: SPOR domain-containing protein [Proteobacteria bacterium]|nr:SPOR domain-containing protein [Pseudomonadota bacterium]HQR04959.1 SPOR domain-containing protein [Rhodocyclaceae bacterium]
MADNAASTDDSSELKKRARRRLVGAAALVLFAVIVLPLVMDREPRPLNPDIQIRIPSQDAAVLPAVTPTAAVPAATVGNTEPADSTRETAPAAQSQAAGTPAKPDGSTVQPAVQPKPVQNAAVPAPVVQSRPATEAKARSSQGQQQSEEARATAALEGRSAGGQWVLQLGAYQESGNVAVLQGKIKELGYPSYTEKVSIAQGARIRVRAGPFGSRESAEKAQLRLKKIGAGGPPGGILVQK